MINSPILKSKSVKKFLFFQFLGKVKIFIKILVHKVTKLQSSPLQWSHFVKCVKSYKRDRERSKIVIPLSRRFFSAKNIVRGQFTEIATLRVLRFKLNIRLRHGCLRKVFYLLRVFYTLDQWFSTEVPRNPWVPWKALGVPPFSKLDVYLLVNCSQGCLQIVL